MVGELSLGGQKGAKLWNAHSRVDGYLVLLCLIVVCNQGKDVVEMGLHTAGIIVHRRGDSQFWICVIVDENYDNDVIADMTLSLQLGHREREREREEILRREQR